MADVIRGPERVRAAADLLGRVKRLLLSPKAEFARIAAEPEMLKDLTIGWIVPLALLMIAGNCIRAFAFGIALQGTADPYFPDLLELPLLASPLFIESVAMPFVSGLIINVLAGVFGGNRNYTQAVRVSAYASTPGWLAGALRPAWEFSWGAVEPPLNIFLFIGALWGMYLLLRGLPPMMASPAPKAKTYTLAASAVLGVFWILAFLITYKLIFELRGVYLTGLPE